MVLCLLRVVPIHDIHPSLHVILHTHIHTLFSLSCYVIAVAYSLFPFKSSQAVKNRDSFETQVQQHEPTCTFVTCFFFLNRFVCVCVVFVYQLCAYLCVNLYVYCPCVVAFAIAFVICFDTELVIHLLYLALALT